MNYKLSKYTTFSDAVTKRKMYLVYCANTSKVHLLDNNIYNKIINNQLMSIESSTLDYLIDNKILIREDTNELKDYLEYSQQEIENQESLYMVIQPSSNCQLGCNYCGQVHSKNNMSDEFIQKTYSRIIKKLTKSNYSELTIGWFGAEPLMARHQIKLLSKKLISYCKKNNIVYKATMTTNGLGLKKELFNELVSLGVKEFDITLDGTQKSHDKRRHTKKGGETFNHIIKNLSEISSTQSFQDNKVSLIIRSNVDLDNYKEVYLLADYLVEKQLHTKISNFYIAPIHSWGNDAHLNSLELEKFAELEIDFMIYLYSKGFKTGLLPNKVKSKVCMSLSKEDEVLDAFGNIFNCTEIPYVPAYEKSNYRIAHLNNTKIIEERAFSTWLKDIENNKFPCHDCKILPVCGGACPKAWHEGNPPCPSLKLNLKERLLLYFHKGLKEDKNFIIH